jgi:hypothetical protein
MNGRLSKSKFGMSIYTPHRPQNQNHFRSQTEWQNSSVNELQKIEGEKCPP